MILIHTTATATVGVVGCEAEIMKKEINARNSRNSLHSQPQQPTTTTTTKQQPLQSMGNKLLKPFRTRGGCEFSHSSDAASYEHEMLHVLPDELLYEIFVLLEPPDIIRLRSTCTYLYRIGHADALWRAIVTHRSWLCHWSVELLEHYKDSIPLGIYEFMALAEHVCASTMSINERIVQQQATSSLCVLVDATQETTGQKRCVDRHSATRFQGSTSQIQAVWLRPSGG
jgi:hypothetical protein